jgi:Ribosomal Proteins L2, C-terminal domain
MYTGQFIYAGKKANLTVGNVLPLGEMPEGTIVTNVEEKVGDRGALARTSGNYVIVIGHNADEGKTRLKLPSGAKKVVPSSARGMVGVVAGGGRVDKPILKAGRAFHKYRVKRNSWPRTRGVAMNPVDHVHGGGNHQHIGKASTVSRYAVPGQKVGLIAARLVFIVSYANCLGVLVCFVVQTRSRRLKVVVALCCLVYECHRLINDVHHLSPKFCQDNVFLSHASCLPEKLDHITINTF